MKQGTLSHPKLLALQRRLKLERWGAVGVLESLWHFTAQYAKAGDIGRFTNSAIAEGIGWIGDPDALIAALTDEHWIDENPVHRLIVHDWSTHAPDAVHMACARAAIIFADGKSPSLTRFGAKERARLSSKLKQAQAEYQKELTARAHSVHTKGTPPSPPLPSPPLPCINHQEGFAEAMGEVERQIEDGEGKRPSDGRSVRVGEMLIPPSLSTPKFTAAWTEFMAYLSEKNRTPAVITQTRWLAEATVQGEDKAIAAMALAIDKNAQSPIYDPIKGNSNGKHIGQQRKTAQERGEFPENLSLPKPMRV